jgi:hypothetical protein
MTPYKEQTASAQNAYADLFDAALALHVSASVAGLNGSFGKKKVHGHDYWYFQFRDIGGAVKQIYLGPECEKLLTLIQNHKSHPDHGAKPLQRLAAAATALGCEPLLPKHFRVIRRLAEYGFFRRGGILVGTHAFTAMGNMLGISPAERMQTQDVDFAPAGKNISVALPANIKVETAVAIESLAMGLLPITTLAGASGSTYLSPTDPAFRLDFLTSKTSESDTPVHIEGLSIALQPLKFMEFSMIDTIQAVVFCNEGAVIVNIPNPGRFAIHKLIVSAERDTSAAVKSNKDIRQANVLIQYYLDNQPEQISATLQDAYTRGPGWRKRLRTGLSKLGKINPDAASSLRNLCPKENA